MRIFKLIISMNGKKIVSKMNAYVNGMSRWHIVYFLVRLMVNTYWHLHIFYSCRSVLMRETVLKI